MSRHRSPDGMRRFYDWFHRFYGIIERNVDASIPRALTLADPEGVFELQNVLEFDDDPGTADRIILSFALHLFPAGQELELLKRCARAAGKGVIVIDHPTG